MLLPGGEGETAALARLALVTLEACVSALPRATPDAGRWPSVCVVYYALSRHVPADIPRDWPEAGSVGVLLAVYALVLRVGVVAGAASLHRGAFQSCRAQTADRLTAAPANNAAVST